MVAAAKLLTDPLVGRRWYYFAALLLLIKHNFIYIYM